MRNKTQAYKGNGKHGWESVDEQEVVDGHVGAQHLTLRLRVPGGWLYRVVNTTGFNGALAIADTMTFVPLPAILVQGEGQTSKGRHAL